MSTIPASDLKRVAIMGTYLPRRCGIATFTNDLAEAIGGELANKGEIFALALDDIPQGYRYPERVRFQLRANYQPDYRLAADFVMGNQANVFILQHEYGIFGGPSGSHVLRLLRELRIPVITTLHTVLQEPTPDQRRVLTELGQLCDRLVVMSHRARQMLQDIYRIPAEKVAFIPHGIPDVPFVDPNYYKDQFKAEGRHVILTFGLLSPNKGIEYMIEAMPEIVKSFPDVLYIVLGATHPHLIRQFGEAYRTGLQRRVADLGLQEHVRFRNQFVELNELCECIGAADAYVTPYLHEQQITSGTLSYAVGAGKAVVSTPYWHAQELLADGRGILVPFKDSGALAEGVIRLFKNDVERHQIRKRAYTFCREMVWRQVAREYLLLGQTLLQERARRPRPLSQDHKRLAPAEELPEVDLRHLRSMTDDTGILQHCLYSIPDRRQGYCIDDNGRGLVVCALHHQLYESNESDELAVTYLSYLSHAYNEKTSRFRNFMSYSRQWLDTVGSEDSQGRALWGLGMMAAHAPNENIRMMAVQLFQDVIGSSEKFEYPRAWAYSLLGIHAYLEHFSGDARVRRIRQELAEKLFGLFRRNASPEWQWCEPTMTYSNATLAHALILAGTWIPDGDMRDQGLRSLQWLCDVQTSDRGHFSFVGNQGWFPQGKEKAAFDQQPIEASQMVLACAEAYRATREECWLAKARLAVEWFLGRNDLDAPLYDFRTGGCCDGLTPEGPNHNQGAESTLAWLIALITFLIHIGHQTLDTKHAEEADGSEEWSPPRPPPIAAAADRHAK